MSDTKDWEQKLLDAECGTNALRRAIDFVKRAKEMGMDSLQLDVIPYTDDRDNLRVRATVDFHSSDFMSHALMGLIAHFKNRNWIYDWSYMYICKSEHIIVFENDKTKSAASKKGLRIYE